MKTFEVGQKVFRVNGYGDILEGTVVYLSPTGASLHVRWGDGWGPSLDKYTKQERAQLLSANEAAKVREDARLRRETQSAGLEYDTVARDLRYLVGVDRKTNDAGIARIRAVTQRLREIVDELKAAP